MGDCVIVGQGVDKSIHGGANEKKEIDPNNRGSVILGSVAYYVDRYGYEVLPLAMKMLQWREVPEANDHAAHPHLRQECLHRIPTVRHELTCSVGGVMVVRHPDPATGRAYPPAPGIKHRIEMDGLIPLIPVL